MVNRCIRPLFFSLMVLLVSGHRPSAAEENWYPSKYGADDTLGAANNLKPEIVRQAADLITTGKVYSLAVDSGPQTPRLAHRSYQAVVLPRSGLGSLGTNQTTVFDEMVCAWQAVGTQFDGLGHLGINFLHYNGIRAEDIYKVDGLKKLSVHAIPPIVTRGVLLDMAKYFGVDMVKEGTAFNRAEIEAAAKRQNIEIRTGDVVLLNTGWINLLERDPQRFIAGQPGLGKDGARYLAGLGIVAVGVDAHGAEVVPWEDPKEYGPVHQILLAKNGVYLMENIDTRGLAADGVTEFLFVLGIPRLVGVGQAIIHPIAIH